MAQKVGLLPYTSFFVQDCVAAPISFDAYKQIVCILSIFIIVFSRKMSLMQATLSQSKKSNFFMRMFFENIVSLHNAIFF